MSTSPLSYVCLDASDDSIEREILGADYRVRMLGAKSASDLPDDVLAAADVVAVWHTIVVDEPLIARLKRARVIVRMGVGYDTVSYTHLTLPTICSV